LKGSPQSSPPQMNESTTDIIPPPRVKKHVSVNVSVIGGGTLFFHPAIARQKNHGGNILPLSFLP
ncbi:hypothetical protein, partial [Bartonella gabonensis]|uniref:hypothetical protein n=1 Tax=Bartonella gabonensis TaxID=2699889 RepID=UPI001AED2DDA